MRPDSADAGISAWQWREFAAVRRELSKSARNGGSRADDAFEAERQELLKGVVADIRNAVSENDASPERILACQTLVRHLNSFPVR